MAFSATSPATNGPASQTVTGTVNGSLSGTLYILVHSTGPAVAGVSNFTINGNTGQAYVAPVPAAILGAGTFTSTITVRACLNDSTCATGELSGSPQTINVTYTIGTTIPADSVMPHVVTVGTAGQVVIRSHGLTGVSAVNFGSTPATAVTVVSDTEVRASYPATLSAQTLPVTLSGGSANFSGSIIALAPESYTAQTLTLLAQPAQISALLYDAEHHALLVAASFSNSSNNQLWRYTYSGSTWTAATPVSIPNLCAITMSNDGAHLLALTSSSLLLLDPANPDPNTATTIPAPFQASNTTGSPYFTGMVLANDGYALVSTAAVGTTGDTVPFLYSSTDASFIQLPTALGLYSWPYGGSPTLAASADGSLLLAAVTGLSPAQPFWQYSPETTLLTKTPASVNQLGSQPPVMDSTASKRLLYDGNTNSVYDSQYALLGKIPGAVRVLTVNRSGTRAYALNQDNTLHTYDLTAATVNGNFPEVGSASSQTLPNNSGAFAIRLAISPDGQGLFVAGDQGILVIPAPQ
jgi:hypothetical protein